MKQQKGFTLVEILVSLVIVGIVTAGMSPVFAAMIQQNNKAELKSGAIEATQRQIDEFRLLDPATLPSSGYTTANITIGGRAFAVKTTYCSPSTYCTAVTRHLTFSTSYRGTAYYATQTVLTQLR